MEVEKEEEEMVKKENRKEEKMEDALSLISLEMKVGDLLGFEFDFD